MLDVKDDKMIDTCTGHFWTTEKMHATQTEVEQREVQKKFA